MTKTYSFHHLLKISTKLAIIPYLSLFLYSCMYIVNKAFFTLWFSDSLFPIYAPRRREGGI